MVFNQFDHECMARAIALAWRGRYSTSPNPRVGCVIALHHQIIAESFHQHKGGAHAEIIALSQLPPEQDLREGTIYITLEPCSHWGATGPCVEALIKRKIGRVVVAMLDPNPLVNGRGFELLKKASIQVDCGLLAQQARELNRGFLSRIERHRPFVILKMAMSLDGKIALKNGISQWITGTIAREDVQRNRAESCAILTGIGTVQRDDPQLNIRSFTTKRQPVRIVLDPYLTISPNAKVIQDSGSPTWLVVAEDLEIQGVKKSFIPPHVKLIKAKIKDGRIELVNLMKLLAKLEIGQLYLECGPKLAGAFLERKLVDELHIYQAPLILGKDALDAFALPELKQLSAASRWNRIREENLGSDKKWILRPQE
ncbi:MAG: bifunctional diaminohydroxyphosphoribosylaminopyrimidine deaminase/5-amino-6-(5-phosphoribosylamino)uracil reductase RibD [Neisseriaceae bacterium]